MSDSWYNNVTVDVYKEYTELKRHQIKMLELLHKLDLKQSGDFLDIGCASGIFLEAMTKEFPAAQFSAMDYNDCMLEMAKEREYSKKVNIFRADAANLNIDSHFDLIHASGVLSIFEDFDKVLDGWIRLLNPRGYLVLFNRFNSSPIDLIIKHRNRFLHGDWETGLHTFSIQTVTEYLEKQNVEFEFVRFNLDLDLPKQADPVRSYTMQLVDGSRIVANGANLITEHYFLIIRNK